MNLNFLFFGIFLLFIFWDLTPENIMFANDAAVSYAVGSSILSGEFALAGPPSHIGGRHPLPFYYYYLALTQFLTGSNLLWSIYLSVLLKSCFVFGVCFFLIKKISTNYHLSFLILSLSLIFGNLYFMIRQPWHGHFTLIPASLYLLALFSFNGKRLEYLIITAILFAGTHFTAIPFVVSSFAFLIWKHNAWKSLLKPQVLFFAFLLILPLILYSLSYNNSFFLAFSSASGTKANLSIVPFLTQFSGFLLSLFYDFKFFGFNLSRVLLYLVIPIFLLISFFAYQVFSKERKVVFLSLLLGIASYLPVFVFVRKQPDMYHFIPIFLPCLLIMLMGTGQLLARFHPTKILGIVLIPLTILGLISRQGYAMSKDERRIITLEHAQEVSKIIKQETQDRPQVYTRGFLPERKNAYLYFLSEESYSKMFYAKKLKELKSFQDKNYQPNSHFLITCGIKEKVDLPEFDLRLKNFRVDKEIDLLSCNSCQTCRLVKLREKS